MHTPHNIKQLERLTPADQEAALDWHWEALMKRHGSPEKIHEAYRLGRLIEDRELLSRLSREIQLKVRAGLTGVETRALTRHFLRDPERIHALEEISDVDIKRSKEAIAKIDHLWLKLNDPHVVVAPTDDQKELRIRVYEGNHDPLLVSGDFSFEYAQFVADQTGAGVRLQTPVSFELRERLGLKPSQERLWAGSAFSELGGIPVHWNSTIQKEGHPGTVDRYFLRYYTGHLEKTISQ